MTEQYIKALKADPRPWLLEEDNPSVRYFALTSLMDKAESHPSVKKAKGEIMRAGPVPTILFRQHEGGYWEAAEDFYVRTKYRGTVWQLIVLAELGADGRDPRVRRAVEFLLVWSQDRESGGFSYRGTGRGGTHTGVIPCLTGSMAWSMARLGYLDDPRVKRGIEWIVNYQRCDDGTEEAPSGWPYDKFEKCWGSHTCHMGVVRTLKALAEIPAKKRTQAAQSMIALESEHLLVHRLFKRSHTPALIAKPAWLDFGFPLMWNTDALDMFGLLVKLGYRDTRMEDSADLILSKQDLDGRWPLETTFNGRFQVNIEKKGRPSKWVTLNALRALRGYLG